MTNDSNRIKYRHYNDGKHRIYFFFAICQFLDNDLEYAEYKCLFFLLLGSFSVNGCYCNTMGQFMHYFQLM